MKSVERQLIETNHPTAMHAFVAESEGHAYRAGHACTKVESQTLATESTEQLYMDLTIHVDHRLPASPLVSMRNAGAYRHELDE